MKFCNVIVSGEERLGWIRGGSIVLLPPQFRGEPLTSTDDMLRRYAQQPDWSAWEREIASVADPGRPAPTAIRYRPSVTRPSKILCIGLNYRRHAEETGASSPTTPVVFSKFPSALAAHQDTIPLPADSKQVDYEAELVVVMGRRASRVTVEDALAYVGGYTTGNDISARDLQTTTSQWLLGKSCERFGPLGPWLITADEVADPNQLSVDLYRNGERVQHSNTADMIFSCAEIVAYLSRIWTLEPGDIIFTGTPEGVILGRPAGLRQWISAGDETRVCINGWAPLINSFQ